MADPRGNLPATHDSISISYAVIGCTPRDAVYLKSVVSLYGAEGKADWHCRSLREVNLVVAGTEISSAGMKALLQSRINPEQIVLWISNSPVADETHRVLYCKAPLRANQLVERLKQVEDLVRRKLPRPAPESAPQAPSHSPGSVEPPPRMETTRFSLARWPPPEILSGNQAFWRMAAMLSVRSMALSELSERSEQPRETCRAFLQGLYRAGYLKLSDLSRGNALSTNAETAMKPKPRPSTRGAGELLGLLRRIRVSLGLSG